MDIALKLYPGKEPELVKINSYKDIQRHVCMEPTDHGIITLVSIDWANDQVVDIYVHDEGLLMGYPLNVEAAALANQWLVGPAVVLGADDEGNSPSIYRAFLEEMTPELLEEYDRLLRE